MEYVAQFHEFTGGAADRQTAIAFIRGNGNDLQQAVMAFFDNPDPSRYKNQVGWDESAFSSDREGGAVHGPVNQSFAIHDSAAPSRPPSRNHGVVNQQSHMPPSYGKTSPDEVWDMSRKDEYEGENEAIQRSLEDHSTRGFAFGQEVVPDADPSDRRRAQTEPAFLKPMTSRDFLPALITVLHSIASCRNAFLSSPHSVDDYGHNPSWWSGEDIQTSTISYQADNDSSPEESAAITRSFEIELQRLMAFLDDTERSYGSVDPLGRLQAVRKQRNMANGSDLIVKNVMDAWDTTHPEMQMFTNVVRSGPATDEHFMDVQIFRIPRTSIPNGQNVSMHEVIDNTLWEQHADGMFETDHFVETLAPVVTIEVEEHSAKQLEVPPSIFLDRYLSINKPVLVAANAHNKSHAETIRKIQTTLDKIQKSSVLDSQSGARKEVPTSDLFSTTVEYLEGRKGSDSSQEGIRDGSVVRKLRDLTARIDARVKQLNEEKSKAEAALKSFSSILTGKDDESNKPEVLYTLRGVARSSFRNLTTYLKHPNADDPQSHDRWWKTSYESSHSGATISVAAVDRQEVLDAAGKGIDKTFLMFASSRLLEQVDPVPLSEALRNFVAADNAAFHAELDSPRFVSQQMQGIQMVNQAGPARRGSESSTKVQFDSEGEDMDQSVPDLRAIAAGEVTPPTDHEMTEVRKEGGMFGGATTGESHEHGGDGMDMDPPSSPEPERVSS